MEMAALREVFFLFTTISHQKNSRVKIKGAVEPKVFWLEIGHVVLKELLALSDGVNKTSILLPHMIAVWA